MSTPENTGRKQADTRFKPGKSGNPEGRPKGSRNATTLALETLLDGQATALTQTAIDLALTGDMAALRLCLDRILPARKDRPVTFEGRVSDGEPRDPRFAQRPAVSEQRMKELTDNELLHIIFGVAT